MKIGIFDSGYGGLTILDKIQNRLPQYDYIYLGDNARTPYGTRSFDVVYKYTWQCVKTLLDMDCALVILACNTASAKALRSIQQNELLEHYPDRRVLGVIRPTAEIITQFTTNNNVGILATEGTVNSNSYPIEINKLYPQINVYQQSCPMFVPLIESNEHNNAGADFFIDKYINQLLANNSNIDTILLACTHYPLMCDKIVRHTPDDIKVIKQGDIVAESLADYLLRHPEIDAKCSKTSVSKFFTTESEIKFKTSASLFLNKEIEAKQIKL